MAKQLKFEIPGQPELQSALNELSARVQLNAEAIGSSDSKLKFVDSNTLSARVEGSMVSFDLKPEDPDKALRIGRFLVRLALNSQRLYVSEGTVAPVPSEVSGLCVPELPTLNDLPINDPESWFDLSTLSSDTEYYVLVVMHPDGSVIEVEEVESGESSDDTPRLVLAKFTLKSREDGASGGGYDFDEFEQLWKSDIEWVPAESSSSSVVSSSSSAISSTPSSSEGPSSAPSGSSGVASSGGGASSGASGGGGSGGYGSSAKSSNAIVGMPWQKGGFGALATVESNEVLFEFVLRDTQLKGAETRVKINSHFAYVCEPNSFTVMVASNDKPWPLAAYIDVDHIVVKAWPLLRPDKVTIRLTGVRRGFADWNMPNRTLEQFEQNEASLRAMYKQ